MKYRIWYYLNNKRTSITVEVASQEELKAKLAKLPPGPLAAM